MSSRTFAGSLSFQSAAGEGTLAIVAETRVSEYLSLIMTMFTEPAERARAMGVYGFVCAGGGSVGVLLGGVLTTLLDWRWIFLVNLPIGLVVALLCRAWIAPGGRVPQRALDWAGATLVTLALLLAVYAVVNGNEAGWTSARTLGLLAVALVLGGAFIAVEARIAQPLVPLGLFRHRNLAIANVSGVFWAVFLSETSVGLFTLWLFTRGTWKTAKV